MVGVGFAVDGAGYPNHCMPDVDGSGDAKVYDTTLCSAMITSIDDGFGTLWPD